MNMRGRLAERLFGGEIERRVQEATAGQEDRWWRSLDVRQGVKDVSFADLLEQQQDALEAYRANPLAFRIVELMSDYVLGKGVQVAARSPEANAFVQRFWQHPLNRMDARLHQLCTELSLAGEVFLTFHTNPYDGMTYVRAVPASLIDEIETNAQDVEDEVSYHQTGVGHRVSGIGDSAARSPLPEARYPHERWWTKEEMRHYAVNRVVGAKRGQGDLTPILPWLRRYKDWLTDRVIINKYKGAYLWDVTLQGATAATVRAKRAELSTPPAAGSIIVHNEAEVWRAIQPTINAEAVEADGKALRLIIAAGAGVPLHFLAEGESATRATAQEMGEPTRRHYEKRQFYLGYMINDILGEVLRRAVQAGALAADEDVTLEAVRFGVSGERVEGGGWRGRGEGVTRRDRDAETAGRQRSPGKGQELDAIEHVLGFGGLSDDFQVVHAGAD